MNQGVPMLVAWPIFRNPLHHKEFLHKLQTFSWHPGGLRQNQTTTRCLQSGLAGVNQGIQIPLLDLYRTLPILWQNCIVTGTSTDH